MVRTYGFLSTYPPTQCGLATFTASPLRHLTAATPGSTGQVVRVLTGPDHEPVAIAGTPMVHPMTPGAVEAAAEALNRRNMVVVRHEYGIYAGCDGEPVLGVLARLRVPVIKGALNEVRSELIRQVDDAKTGPNRATTAHRGPSPH